MLQSLLGFRVSGLRVQGLLLGFRVWGLGFRAEGLGFRVLCRSGLWAGAQHIDLGAIGRCMVDPLRVHCLHSSNAGKWPELTFRQATNSTSFQASTHRLKAVRFCKSANLSWGWHDWHLNWLLELSVLGRGLITGLLREVVDSLMDPSIPDHLSQQ